MADDFSERQCCEAVAMIVALSSQMWTSVTNTTQTAIVMGDHVPS